VSDNRKYIQCAVQLALSTADIRAPDGTLSPETNRMHLEEAMRLAREILDEHDEAELRRLQAQ